MRRWREEGRTQLPSYLAVWCWHVFTFEEKRKLTGEGGAGGPRAWERLTITPWESQGNCLAMLAETQNPYMGIQHSLPLLWLWYRPQLWMWCGATRFLASYLCWEWLLTHCYVWRKTAEGGGEVPPRVRGISLLVSVRACLHYQLLHCSVPG